jgi:hypothetical protein
MAEKHAELVSELLGDTMESYRKLKELRETGKSDQIDYDYECVRDRKTVLAVKLIAMDISQEKLVIEKNRQRKSLGK